VEVNQVNIFDVNQVANKSSTIMNQMKKMNFILLILCEQVDLEHQNM